MQAIPGLVRLITEKKRWNKLCMEVFTEEFIKWGLGLVAACIWAMTVSNVASTCRGQFVYHNRNLSAAWCQLIYLLSLVHLISGHSGYYNEAASTFLLRFLVCGSQDLHSPKLLHFLFLWMLKFSMNCFMCSAMDCAAGWLQLQSIWTVIISAGLSFVASSLTVLVECSGLHGFLLAKLVVWSSVPALSFQAKLLYESLLHLN